MTTATTSSSLIDDLRHPESRPLRLESIGLRLTSEEIVNVLLFTYLATNGGIHVPIGNQALLNLFDHQLAAFFWIGSIWVFVRNGTRLHWELWSCKFAFIFLIYTVFSIFWGDSPLSTTWYPTMTGICTFLYYNYLLDRYELYAAIRMMTWCFTILLLLSLVAQLVAPEYALDDGTRDPNNLGALQGIFNQKNILAVVATLSFAIGLGLSPRTSIDRVWRVTLLVLSISCAWLSQSREGWVAMAAVIPLALLMTLTSRMHPRSRLPVVLIGLGALLASCFLLYYNLDDFLRLLGRTRDASGRTEIWSSVLLMIARRPWFGYGTWGVWGTPLAWDAVVRSGWSITSSHNNYLEIILSYGYVGFALYMPIMIFSVYFIGRAMLSYEMRDSRVLIYVMVSIFILSFAVVLMMFSPSVGMILMLYCTSHLEMVDRSGFMSLRTSE
jgi:O-antigen ligase